MIPAIISQSKGLAITLLDDEYIVIDVLNPNHSFKFEDTYIAKLLQELSDAECIEVSEIQALRTHLEVRRNREELLLASLIILDRENSAELRALAGEKISSGNYSVWLWVKGVLLSAPLPPSADAVGAARLVSGEPHHFFVELLSLQPQIQTLQTAWNALPESSFHVESRDQTRSRLVRLGIFHQLLMGVPAEERNPFSIVVNHFSESLRKTNDRMLANPRTSADTHFDRASNLLWTMSPWRTSQLSSEWQRIESTLACQAAWYHIEHILPNRSTRVPLKKFTIDRLYNSWSEVRNDREICRNIDLIYELTNFSGRAEEEQLTAINGKKYDKKTKKRLSKFPSAYKRMRDFILREKTAIGTLILDFFGMATVPQSSVPKFATEIYQRALTDPTSQSFRVHAENQLFINFDANILNFEESKFRNNFSSKNKRIFFSYSRETDQDLLDALRTVLCLYSLDTKFKTGGFIVFIPSGTGKLSTTSAPVICLSNLQTRSSRSFNGFAARILDKLQTRLVSDLKSGLPADNCGWLPVETLAKDFGKTDNVLNETFNDIKNNIELAGFSPQTFQSHDGGVRLNPMLTACSRIN